MAEAAGPLTGGAGVDTKPDEKLSTKFNKAATMGAVEELLLETLDDLSYEEQKSFTWFLQFTFFQRSLPQIPWSRLQDEDVAESLVDVMLETCGQKSVEVTREVLMDMNQTDLVQRLSETSSGPKEKHSVDEDWPAMIQKVESMESVIELLLETLKDLSDAELKMFKGALSRQPEFHRHFLSTPLKRRLPIAHVQHTVFSMVQICGQKCVEKTNEILKTMKRTDLVQRLSDSSSGSKKKHSADEHRSALIHKVATIAAVQQLLLETLNDLSDTELKIFKKILQSIVSQKNLPDILWVFSFAANRADIVNRMVEIYGQQSVELTREVFMDMKRTDLVQRLSKPSTGLKEKHSVGKHPPASSERAATMGAVQELLLETLSDLSYEEQKTFILFLQFTFFQRSLPQIPLSRLQKGNMTESLVDVMVETCGQKSVEVTREVLMDMNQTDLVQRLSETSSGPKAAAGSSAEVFGVNTTEKEKHSVEEDRPALIQKVETMESVIELLLETLKDLSKAELERFKSKLCPVYLHGASPVKLVQQKAKYIPSGLLDIADMQGTVCLIVQSYGQQSVERAKEILKTMKRTDLVQRLSDSSSRPKEKLSVNKHQSALFKKAATMGAVKELLSETLYDLSYEEQKTFTWFLQFTFFQRSLPQIPWGRLQDEDIAESLVDAMVEKCGQKSVEVTREVLMDMNQTDLVQRLSETSSGLKAAAGSSAEVFGVNTTEKEKHSVEEDWPALIQKVQSMDSVIELLLETLKDLSDAELEKFKHTLLGQSYIIRFPDSTVMLQTQTTHVQDTVFIIMLSYSQHVEKTKDILKTMQRTDLVQRLSDSSSGSKKKHSADEHRSALIHKVATIAAVQQLLLETLNDLSDKQLKKFKNILQSIVSQKNLPHISWVFSFAADTADIVNQMVQTYGQQSVELTREVFMDMKRTDLVQRLSKPSSGLKEKHSVGKHPPASSEREVTMTSLQEKLLETLEDFSLGDLEKFKHVLLNTEMKEGQEIPRRRLETADRVQTVELMVELYGQQSEEVIREVFNKMNRRDLVQRLSDISLGSEGPSRSLEHEDCGSAMQDSSDWTKLEPEVNSTDADEAPTYSLQSEAGNFECSVSGLRWVCKEKVSFKYQFCPWEEPMERMESMKYRLAGPLIDITVHAGKLDVVYLPHWICIDDNPEIRDEFAVLHIDDCGDVVEKVAEVTSSHVKLLEPVFSPRAVLMKFGVPVKINCHMLIYKTNTAFLTLHVYLIPCDPGLQQELNRRQLSSGYKAIQKPNPEKSLKMGDRFILTADSDDAKIYPENLKLRYKSRFPNFFEVYIKKPDTDFTLSLAQKNEPQSVWTREIRKDEYQSTGHIQVEHFVDKHQCDLIARVCNTGPILDNLFRKGVIQQEDYDTIMTIPTTQEKMRKLYSGPLKAGGQAAKDIFCQILEEKESYLVADLRRKES